jgi:NAD(P)-dependent dehydrogenase (short-subunit alcohol dehydrogenase family)
VKVLTNRVALVTGGASGIGFALARAFADEGMKIVLADVEEPMLTQAHEKLTSTGADVLAVPIDVSQESDVRHLADATLQKFGAIHIVCNNAGVSLATRKPMWMASIRDWEWMLGVNVWGVIHGIRTFVPILLEQDEAHIVNTASIAGLVPAALGVYSVTKHAVVALSEALQLELAAAKAPVGVSVLCPGWVRTRIGEAERNRPARFHNEGPEAVNPMVAAGRAALLASGTSPEMVAERVVDAVLRDRFYVLPHPEWIGLVRDRTDAIARGDPPTVPDLGSVQSPVAVR